MTLCASEVRSDKLSNDPRETSATIDPVEHAMTLAQESMGAWTRARKIPVLYRYNESAPGYPVDRLNKLGPHEGYIGFTQGYSTSPLPHITKHLAQMVSCTSPLRLYVDIVALWQVDAYLKAEAAAVHGTELRDFKVDYPYSNKQLMHLVQTETDYSIRVKMGRTERSWLIREALLRSIMFKQAKVPEIWDVCMPNPVATGTNNDIGVSAVLVAFGLKVKLCPTEQGWEQHAKYRQYLPVKVVGIRRGYTEILCEAVGPPTDEPRIKGPAYPELAPREE